MAAVRPRRRPATARARTGRRGSRWSSRTAVNGLLSLADVTARAAVGTILARVADQVVLSGAPEEVVVARPAHEQVRGRVPDDHVRVLRAVDALDRRQPVAAFAGRSSLGESNCHPVRRVFVMDLVAAGTAVDAVVARLAADEVIAASG